MRLPPVGTMLHLSHRVPDPSSCPSEHSARLRNCTSDATRPPYPISKKKEAKVRPAPLSLLRPCRHYPWGDVWRCAAARSCTLRDSRLLNAWKEQNTLGGKKGGEGKGVSCALLVRFVRLIGLTGARGCSPDNLDDCHRPSTAFVVEPVG